MSNVYENLDIGLQEYVAHLQADYDRQGGNQFIEVNRHGNGSTNTIINRYLLISLIPMWLRSGVKSIFNP